MEKQSTLLPQPVIRYILRKTWHMFVFSSLFSFWYPFFTVLIWDIPQSDRPSALWQKDIVSNGLGVLIVTLAVASGLLIEYFIFRKKVASQV